MRKRLAKYGLPEPILREWERRFGGRLLPLQYRAVEEGRLFEGASLLISAPTSSGKTFCGEMALIRAITERKKAVFLVPLKAVAEEKFRQFADCYGSIGLRVIIGTRDHPEYDADLENGRFDIAVAVYEKFNALLLANFDLISQVGTVVIDELQMLEDPNRGAQLELAMSKMLYSEYSPQLIALSAVLGEASGLAQWLGCRLLLEKVRPVELRRGVAADGRFFYRCHNSGETGEESCPEAEESVRTLFENIEHERGRNRQAIVFLKSRFETVRAAIKFAEYAGLEIIDANKDFFSTQLADEEESSLLDNLVSLANCGIAFHNADLTTGQRAAVEEGYRAGLVSVIFATTTLSTGINLPAATVFIEAQKYGGKSYTGKAGLEPLSWAEYESMSGRAGRVGLLDERAETGRAVLFASGELEKSILWDYYIDKRPEPLTSRLGDYPVEDIIVDLFASQLVRSPEEIEGLLGRSYAHLVNPLHSKGYDVDLKVLVEDGFLESAEAILTATPQGSAVAVTGLSCAGARFILSLWGGDVPHSDEEVVYDLLRCPDIQALYLPSEGAGLRVPERHSVGDSPLLRSLTRLRRELTADEIRRARLAFLFVDWMSGTSALDIEHDYRLYLGMMENVARQAAWLLASAASLIRARDRYSPVPRRLERLSFSVGAGLPYEMKSIHENLDGVLHRRELLELYRLGITSLDSLVTEGPAAVAKIVSSESRLKKFEETLHKIKENTMSSSSAFFSDALMMPQSIEIDGTPIRERYRVRINGQSINLTGKSFKYLCRLAWSRLTKDNGWLYKEDLEQGFNQARYLYRLRQEIGKDFLPGWPLYENNRSGYYRLVAPKDGISVNVDSLRANPDYEIRQIVGDLAPRMTQ